MQSSLLLTAAILSLSLIDCGGDGAREAPPPNIVLIVADDLGWNDVSYHGSEIPTPHIDQLAAEGLELDRFYTMANCSPTRMGLLTGRYPIRWGMMNTVIRPWETKGLPAEEETLAEMMAGLGYEHRALVGKWHVGHASRDHHPLRQGFTEFYGHYNGAIDYYDHMREGEVDWHRGYEPIDESGQYTTDLITDAAVRFIEARQHATPFFLFVSYNAPHFPLQAPPDCMDRVSQIEGENRRTLAAMVSCMDDGIGRITSVLDRTGLAENTLVWFLSDNGGSHRFGASSNVPLRGAKSSVFEGGIRVPSAIRWPRGGLAGGRKVTGLTGYIDVLPTLRAVAGAREATTRTLDGLNVLGMLRGDAEPRREWFTFTSLATSRSDLPGEASAVTTQEWKLVRYGPPDTPGELALFRIRDDPGESTNVAAEHPEVVRTLTAKLREFRSLQPDDALVPSSAPGPVGWRAPRNWRMPDPGSPD